MIVQADGATQALRVVSDRPILLAGAEDMTMSRRFDPFDQMWLSDRKNCFATTSDAPVLLTLITPLLALPVGALGWRPGGRLDQNPDKIRRIAERRLQDRHLELPS